MALPDELAPTIAMTERARTLPRVLDVALASLFLLLAAPVLLAIGVVIGVTGHRSVFFVQERLGRGGRPFRMHKFRTLAADAVDEGRVAPKGDPRVTRVGGWLRHTRLDELPQLYDVLRGAMALVGPRPETAASLASVDAAQLARWLSVRPGITGATQLAFIAEDDLLAEVPNPTETYREVLVPAKVAHGIEWMAKRTARSDLAVLLRTPVVLASRGQRSRSRRYVAALLKGEPSEPVERSAPRSPGGGLGI